MDLVEPEVGTEQPSALGDLAPKRVERELLDLVHVGVDLPVGRVGVAPLRADRHRSRCQPAAVEPRGEELLGLAVRTGRVEVADAAGVRGVEDDVRLALERGDVFPRAEVVAVTEVDIARPAERGYTEAQPA